MQKIVLSIFIFIMFITTAFAASSNSIIKQYNDFRSRYHLPVSDKNFDTDSFNEYQKFTKHMDKRVNDTKTSASNVLIESLKYLKDHKKNPHFKEFQTIARIAKQLKNYISIQDTLRDDGCLNSNLKKVRSVTNTLLTGAIVSDVNTNYVCEIDRPQNEQEAIDDLNLEIEDLTRCLDNESCTSSESIFKGQGILDQSLDKKLDFIKRHEEIKNQALDYSKALLNYAFEGKCTKSTIICNKIKTFFPGFKGNNPTKIKEKLIILADEQSLIGKDIARFARSSLISTNTNYAGISSSSKETKISFWAKKNTVVDFVFNNQFVQSNLAVFTNLQQKILSGPLRLATANSYKVCKPEILDHITKGIEITSSGTTGRLGLERSSLSIKHFPQLSLKDLICIKNQTKKDFENHNQYLVDFRKDMREFDNKIDNSDKEELVNSTIKNILITDPLAVGAQLVNNPDSLREVDLCKTILELSKEINDKNHAFNVKFAAINVGSLVALGVTLFVAGPLTIPAGLIGVTIALIDGYAYGIKEGKARKNAFIENIHSAQVRVHSDSQINFKLFKERLSEYTAYMNKAESHRFWKIFAYISGTIGGVGTGINTLTGGLINNVGKLGPFGIFMVNMIAKGGEPGKKLVESIITLVKKGDLSISNLHDMLILRLRHMRQINVSKLHGAHHHMTKVESVLQKIEAPVAAFFASSYIHAAIRTTRLSSQLHHHGNIANQVAISSRLAPSTSTTSGIINNSKTGKKQLTPEEAINQMIQVAVDHMD